MKKSSPLAPGRNHSQLKIKVPIWRYLLSPFYSIILFCLPFADLLVFVSERLFQSCFAGILLHHPSRKKIISWTITILLVCLAVINALSFSYYLGHFIGGKLSADQYQQKQIAITNEQIFSLPKDLQIASHTPMIKLNEKQIDDFINQERFVRGQYAYLSQIQALNYALANYYQGNWEQYLSWREYSKSLDPNSEFWLKQSP